MKRAVLLTPLFVFLFPSACALLPSAAPGSLTPAAHSAPPAAASPAIEVAQAPAAAPAEAPPVAVTADGDAVADDEEEVDDEGPSPEGESHDVGPGDGSVRYTSDFPDPMLQELWKNAPEKLGSISFGFVDEGRLLNSQQFPQDPTGAWTVVSPALAWGTQETIEQCMSAIREVKRQYPDAPPLRVNQISAKDGGYLRPHKSHQNGRDVDLAFYYPTADPVRAREREKYIDVAKNWALLKALVTLTDVQFILVDKRVQKVIYEYALKSGENKAWLDSLFNAGRDSAVMHARRHRDHFHVRFFNARAQELGRRVAPLLAQRPEQNIAIHRVRSGDTLGRIAQKYGSSVNALRKANRMKSTFLRVAQVVRVPLRGPCTHCPVPPVVVLPSRRVPPTAGPLTPEPVPSQVAEAPGKAAPGMVVPAAAAGVGPGPGAVQPASATEAAPSTPAAAPEAAPGPVSAGAQP